MMDGCRLSVDKQTVHMFHVFEDAKDYSWLQVREWSEELFCQLAQKSTPVWDDAFEYNAQLLRAATSKAQNGKLSAVQSKTAARYNNAQPKTAKDRRDVQCPAFNTAAGCTKNDQHTSGQATFGHHCKYCRETLDLVHVHPATQCRIK